MLVKNIIRSTLFSAAFLAFSVSANAQMKFYGGIGSGISLVKWNEDNIPWEGSNIIAAPATIDVGTGPLPTGATNEQLKTTYKYQANQPVYNLHLELGVNKTLESMKLLDRSVFVGAALNWSYGRSFPSKGITNPNANYRSTGSVTNFYMLNARLGLENDFSKIYALTGLTYMNTDVPYDILPAGSNTLLSSFATCTAMAPGSAFIGGSGAVCNNINVKSAYFDSWFLNLGAGAEMSLSKQLNFFVEYIAMLHLDRNRTHSIKYSYNGQNGEFKGKIKIESAMFVKAGVRYYF